ncbi:hypothetical protein N7495_003759 [Penicillium taxi]|uniref:uncharacterized protein n=1 Tax=Penicillium taxi TaxID=168475 RepID=UPI00254502D8|nr:uncharacterized protein N7495_003759 [Penicillium taxi]KAJ5899015.1 hypothetical protein N7495_003759 [Penicillium taxi]
MSDRTSATTFRAGPPSPPSPSAWPLKESHTLLISSDHFPQTPQSPPLMSVSDPSHVSNFASSQASPNQATTQPNTSSPPSSTPMSTQVSQQPTMSTTNSFPTPASSVSGHLAHATFTEDNDQKYFTAGNQGPIKIVEDQEHRRTDHNRQTDSADGTNNSIGQDQLATDEDAMDVDNETAARPSSRDLGLDCLQDKLTSAFHLCKSLPIVSGPDPSVDLVSLYGLGPVAQSVARMDHVTGEKINRLRKSYEGKLKGLGLAGRNKPNKQEPGSQSSLRYLTMWPEEEWQNQNVFGKQIKLADNDSALHGLHNQAMQLEPGTMPQNDFWGDLLGHEKPVRNQGTSESGKKSAPTPGTRPAIQKNASATTAEERERARTTRGRKRNYDDNSFVGYGEGYVDDDDDPGFYSNSEGTGKKKRKKDHVSKVSTPMSERGGSYGVGIYGIGAR